MHKHFSGIQMGLQAMIWFYDYYGVIKLFIRKSYFRGLLMITTSLGWQNISSWKQIVFLQMLVWLILSISLN